MFFSNISLCDENFIYKNPHNQKIVFVESQKDGEGSSFFKSSKDSLVIKAKNKSPIVWAMKNKKCAEGAFLTQSEEKTTLHILEMKSKVNLKDFEKVIEQISGMYLSALSIVGLMKIPYPDEVIVYLAYKENSIDGLNSTEFISHKSLVGVAQKPELTIWKKELLRLPHGIQAKIIKKQRTETGDVDFGQV